MLVERLQLVTNIEWIVSYQMLYMLFLSATDMNHAQGTCLPYLSCLSTWPVTRLVVVWHCLSKEKPQWKVHTLWVKCNWKINITLSIRYDRLWHSLNQQQLPGSCSPSIVVWASVPVKYGQSHTIWQCLFYETSPPKMKYQHLEYIKLHISMFNIVAGWEHQ